MLFGSVSNLTGFTSLRFTQACFILIVLLIISFIMKNVALYTKVPFVNMH